MTAPLLVFGWGNRSRGDDALGPLLVDRLRAQPHDPAAVEFLDDYQLMVEHVFDLQQRERVLLVDASRDAVAPFEARPVRPASGRLRPDTHALAPQALLRVYVETFGIEPPPCTLLGIRAETFGLGEAPTAAALANLDAALAWAAGWLRASG